MASRFLVAVALFAVCHSSPLNDDVIYRNQRSNSIAEASSISNNQNEASAIIEGYNAKAYSRNNIARDALDQNGPAGQAYAKAGHYDSPNTDGAFGIAKAQPAYYPVPETVIAYQQYDAPAEVRPYVIQQGPSIAQTSASTNGHGSASSLAQTNGIVTPIDYEPAVIAAKNYGYNTVYNNQPHNSAISTANVHGQGTASSFAKTGPARKSISWRFGTAYDNPASYAKSAASSLQYSNVPTLNTAAQSQGTGAAQSTANNYGARSAVNTYGGAAKANAAVNDQGYAYLRTGEQFGAAAVQSNANSNGFSSANSNANFDLNGHGIAKANANSHEHGAAQSSANTNAGYGLRSAGWGGNTGARAQANGLGDAKSFAENHGNGYRVANSAVSSHGPGAAHSAAQSV